MHGTCAEGSPSVSEPVVGSHADVATLCWQVIPGRMLLQTDSCCIGKMRPDMRAWSSLQACPQEWLSLWSAHPESGISDLPKGQGLRIQGPRSVADCGWAMYATDHEFFVYHCTAELCSSGHSHCNHIVQVSSLKLEMLDRKSCAVTGSRAALPKLFMGGPWVKSVSRL